jgi:N-acetylmuramoyl-L-alanine amidase
MLEIMCLALNIFHEARNQSISGQIAVSQVVMNRVLDQRYPNTPCKVIKQGIHSGTGIPLRSKCQFSWYCDGKSDHPRDFDAFRWAQIVAQHVLSGESLDLVDGATHYHTLSVSPNWKIRKTQTTQIEDHVFYRWEKE